MFGAASSHHPCSVAVVWTAFCHSRIVVILRILEIVQQVDELLAACTAQPNCLLCTPHPQEMHGFWDLLVFSKATTVFLRAILAKLEVRELCSSRAFHCRRLFRRTLDDIYETAPLG